MLFLENDESMDIQERSAPAAGDLPLLRGTKGRILRLLRAGTLTADDLAAALEITPNGARFHLAELERDGLVTQRTIRRGPRKPSYGYSLTERGEALFPRRYDALLNAVLEDTRAGRTPDDVRAMFRRLGSQLAAQHALRFFGLGDEARLAEALRVLDELGGAAEAVADAGDSGTVTVAGRSCPFKAIVPAHPEVCTMLEAFLAEVLPGTTVRECCDKGASGGAPHCRFEIQRKSPLS
jgi:predicted ArsR family transcriptional regulator